MSDNKATTTMDPETAAVLHQARGFWDRFSKPIIYIGSAVIVLIAGWYSYKNFIQIPKENKAKDAIFRAEKIFDAMSGSGFNKDSVNLVLNGGLTTDGNKITGVLKVISEFDGTETANRGHFIAGACYLQTGEFDKAINQLKSFKANGASQVESRAYIMIGHAYAEQKKNDDAFSYYKKAASVNEKDETMTTDALNTAAAFAAFTGKTKDAIELYSKLKEKYPTSTMVTSGEVDKQLAKLGQFN